MIGTAMKMYAYGKAPRATLALRHPKQAAQLFGYAKAPKAMFALSHPRTASRLAKMRWDMRHALAPRVAAAGVAALSLPIGIALGRALKRNGRGTDAEL